jgi:NAD(P)H-hydrate epimerase
MITSTLRTPYEYYLLNAKLSQEVDRRTIDEMDIDGFTLMEIAGSSAAKKMLERETNLTRGIFLCGKGNNGGDALVIARYLLQHDIDGTIVFISGTEELSPDAEKNFGLLQEFDTRNNISVVESWKDFEPPSYFDFIVDGMLGTGLESDPRGDYAKAIAWANEQTVPIFAIDIPTGLHSDSGKIMGCAVNANRTFAFGGHKQGFYLNGGPSLTGEVDYCELPFPNAFKETCSTYLLDKSWISMPSPTPGRHKYDSGVLYLVAGSEGLTGAAIMAAQSAWAEGLGAVILICPRAMLSIYEQNLPSIIKKPVGSRDDYFFKTKHATDVLEIIREKEGTILLGPGLGRDDETVEFVDQFLSQNTADTVIDADGLWCFSQFSEWKKPDDSAWILMPHPGELKQLTQSSVSDDHRRLKAVRNYAKKHNVTVLSKGMPCIIGTPAGKCYLTNYNTQYFARAGSGDVLAGKVSAFLALGYASDHSSAMGLLRGKQKLDRFLNHNKGLPEPKDFI